MNVEDIKKQLQYEEEKEKRNTVVNLPLDYGLLLRADAASWLSKYGITDEERMKYQIGWSDIYESLVLPAHDIFGSLLLVQRRYFGTGPFQKYITKGYPESTLWTCRPRHIARNDKPEDSYNGTIILVEDYVSAVKVGREHEAMPLWGSSLSLGQIKKLADRWERIVFWLDFNKTKESMKFRIKAEPYFLSAYVVATEKDPKDYATEEIRDYLNLTVE